MESFDDRLALRIRQMRKAGGLTLEALAERSGVSRSMISLIERSASSPTASVLDKLAAALGVSLATLFTVEARPDALPLARRGDQPEWSDPQTGYIRRSLSPAGFASAIELSEILLPAGVRVAYDSGFRRSRIDHQIWMVDGEMEVSFAEVAHRLGPGDCLAYRSGGPVAFANLGSTLARYLVGTASPSAASA